MTLLRAVVVALASWSLGLDARASWAWVGPRSHVKHGPLCDCLY